jgi:hypothetical protein
MKRRGFLQTVVSTSGALGGSFALSQPTGAVPAYPFKTLAEAMAAAGFDPRDASSFTVVWAADMHYGCGDAEQILPPVIREVNAIDPRPSFFGIAGDLICKGSLCFGQVPDEQQKKEAIEEFNAPKRHLQLLDPRIPIKLTLGNHDTYPGERTPELFHTVFPDEPVDHAFTVKGVRFIFLNGGSSGLIGEKQRAWFREEVRENHKPGGSLVMVVHQPSLGSVTFERGITAAFREAMAECEGELWMVAGHIHANGDTCFRLPRAVITQASITTANPAMWGEEQPGYWIYGFTHGQLKTRIFRRLGQGFSVAPPPPLQQARPLYLPFEGQDDILWKVLVGEGDRPYLVEASAAWCLNYWHYNHHLIYRFPLSLARGRAKHFLVLESPCGQEPRQYFVSPDGQSWQEVTTVARNGCYTRFEIPKACHEAGTIAIRIEQCVVSGFALTE